MAYINPNNNFSCSSWNYGAYAACNPCYVQQIKAFSQQKQSRYFPPQNDNLFNKYGKRPLREEEKIVTNEYLQNINHMKKMEKNKDRFRTKSAIGMRLNQRIEEKDEPNILDKNIKKGVKNYNFGLTYEEWLQVKNKQKRIFNQIKKIKEQENEKMEKINMKVDKKYKEIKDKKYKEWLDNKNKEFRMKKQMKMQEELLKEEMKKEKDAEREEKMNEWFKAQAKKMEKEILEKQEELRKKKEKEQSDKEEKKRKRKESKIIFKQWKEKKDEELREKKKEKMMQEYETKSKSKHSNYNNKGFTIGPYTDAGALKEIQKFINERCTQDEDEEKGIINDNEIGGGEEEMPTEQLEQMQMNDPNKINTANNNPQ